MRDAERENLILQWDLEYSPRRCRPATPPPLRNIPPPRQRPPLAVRQSFGIGSSVPSLAGAEEALEVDPLEPTVSGRPPHAAVGRFATATHSFGEALSSPLFEGRCGRTPRARSIAALRRELAEERDARRDLGPGGSMPEASERLRMDRRRSHEIAFGHRRCRSTHSTYLAEITAIESLAWSARVSRSSGVSTSSPSETGRIAEEGHERSRCPREVRTPARRRAAPRAHPVTAVESSGVADEEVE